MEINRIYLGDCLSGLKKMKANSVDCCITSPPYFGLRDYGHADQLGLEKTVEEYIQKIVEIFQEVHRVLKTNGTLWLNLGDSYIGTTTGSGSQKSSRLQGGKSTQINAGKRPDKKPGNGLKNKDLIGIPWMAAFALRGAGWFLRQDIIWHKLNPMPESVVDRCTKAHEYIFLMSKSGKYYYDQAAIMQPLAASTLSDGRFTNPDYMPPRPDRGYAGGPPQAGGGHLKRKSGNKRRKTGAERGCPEIMAVTRVPACPWEGNTANKRSVWTVSGQPFVGAHFATFPPALIVDCIKAGCPENGTVLDPFMGAGTTAVVARKLNRNFIGFELNPDYIKIAEKRLRAELGLFV